MLSKHGILLLIYDSTLKKKLVLIRKWVQRLSENKADPTFL